MWLIGTNTKDPFPKGFKTKTEATAFARLYFAGTGSIFFVWKAPRNRVLDKGISPVIQ